MDFVKVIYFDESSVTDFMQIIAGGEIKKTTEFISNLNTNIQNETQLEAGISTDTKGLSKLFGFLSGVNLNANTKVDAGVGYKKDRMVKNILENTLLADFIELFEKDKLKNDAEPRCKGIEVFNSLSVYPEQNSFSFLMLAAPFFTMLDGDVPIPSNDGSTFKLDISKIEEAIKRGRGYYEFLAKYEERDIILRFNSTAFRNNYTMSDLPKMQLTFYAISVGKIDKNKLKIEREFEFGSNNFTRTNYQGNDTSATNENIIDVYDVILAGIVKNNE